MHASVVVGPVGLLLAVHMIFSDWDAYSFKVGLSGAVSFLYVLPPFMMSAGVRKFR